MSASDRIEYPNQLKPITDDLRDDELVKRLKALSLTLQEMGQDEDVFTNYVPLALHLARDFFLKHESKDVQLLVACSIADVLRVFAPEAPYKDPDHVKTIFLFLIRQLNGLKDPKDPAFKRYFYLCENLAYVKSFNMCFELVDCQEIFCALFTLIFRIVNDEHSQKVKTFMLEILVPLISESDSISPELLDIILVNVIEPYKTQRKNAYALAKELIKKTSDSLSIYVQSFLNDALISDKPDKNLTSSKRIYDLIYELNVISPALLLSVLPQLECKIKAVQESERLKAVSLLARMFSEKDSNLAKQHNGLLNHFLGRFLDIAVAIRIKCVQSTMHFLVNHPSLRADIIQVLNGRQHDSDEMVRFEVVNSIVETAKRDYKVVSESQELMGILKERSQDKKFKIRRAAMNGLALIYNKYLTAVIANEPVPEEHLEAAKWIQIRILNGYYNATLDDQLLIERLVITHLVPYQLPANDRMKALYKLLATIDDHALKAFVELQKNQIKHKKNVLDWVKLHRHKETPESKKEIYKKATIILKLFPDPFKSEEFLTKFSGHLRQDRRMMMDMDTILKRDVECKECADAMTNILKKLGTPIMTNIYYNTIKILLSRIASVMIDKEGIEVLIHLIEGQLQQINQPKVVNDMEEEHLMKENNLLDSLNLKPEDTSARGLNLLTVLIYLFPAHFLHESVLRPMASLLSFEFDFVSASIFKALTHLGRFKPLIESHPGVLEDLAPICKDYAIKGTPKQAKHALRCLFVNSQCAQLDMDAEEDNCHQKQIKTRIDDIFQEIVDATNNSLTPSSPNYRTAIVCFGHIAYNLPERFNIALKNIVSRKIVKELLISKLPDKRTKISEDDWCDEDQLAEELRCRVEGLKAIARWLVGLKDNVLAAQKTFRMLFAFIGKDGDILEQNVMTPAEKSWMRLSAGNAMLKICEQKGVGDEYNAEQFLTLSSLLNDPVLKVRELFLKKLHKGLYKGIPHKCLPLDFMGFYVLAGREVDKKLREQLKNNYEIDVNHRREYVKTFSNGGIEGAISQLSNILPDYIVPFAIAILAHSNLFQDRTNIEQLKLVEKCLNFILEPLINSKETFCFSLYTNMIQRMKHSKSAYKSDNQEINEKLWTICDMALHIILTKLKTVDMREYTLEQVCIPTMYYQEQLPTFNNKRDYLSQEYKRLTAAKNADGTEIAKTSVATMQPSTAAKRPNAAPPQRIKRQKNDVIS